MVRRVHVVTGKKSVRTPREGVIVRAVEGALESLESRQLLSVASVSSASTSLSSHAKHVAHVKHLNHMRHVQRSTGSLSVSSSAAVAASTPVAAPPAPAFTTVQQSADGSVVFEAENGYVTDPDNDGRTWQVKSGAAANGAATTASGGAALYSDRPIGSNGNVTYHIHFNAPGI
jgi:hypothetical protein